MGLNKETFLTLMRPLRLVKERVGFWGKIIFMTLGLAGCAEAAPSILEPQGPAAAEIAGLWWTIFYMAVAVFAVVLVLILVALFHPRRQQPADHIERRSFSRDKVLILGGGGVTVIILIVIYFLNLNTMAALANEADSEVYTIRVIGHQWWWEVHYPGQGVITANEIHIPVNQPVRIEAATADVIHSVWVPELQGKIDMIPGRTNQLWLEANNPGIFYGECAEFCGVQHAKMAFLVIAEPEEQFVSWLEAQRQPAAEVTDPALEEGQAVFLGTTCVNCHTVRGTPATGVLGPDLTHLASRRTLGAAAVENTPGNLGGWISDPHSIKPGNKMPPSDLTGEELQALLTYLNSLE